MENSSELTQKGKYLGIITEDFVKVAAFLREASYALRKRKISDYPIFPVSKDRLSLGQILLNREERGLKWHYYFSYLEEFTQRQLVSTDRTDDFKRHYKNADEFCCLFVVDGDFVNFIFIPYPNDDEENND